MATHSHQSLNIQRRNLLTRLFQWGAAIATGLLMYPLLRFTNYTVKPKPRYITVPAPLPISGYFAERDFILFVKGPSPLAVSRKCTHLGCRVSYLEDKQIIECPCHQSRFTREGKLISGPAEKNLPTYPVEIKKDPEGKVAGYVVTL